MKPVKKSSIKEKVWHCFVVINSEDEGDDGDEIIALLI